jgi:hypothetical protein
MKSVIYKVQSPGIGYEKNVKAVEERLRAIINVSDVSRYAIACIVWGTVAPSSSGYIEFTSQDIQDAADFLIHDLQVGV